MILEEETQHIPVTGSSGCMNAIAEYETWNYARHDHQVCPSLNPYLPQFEVSRLQECVGVDNIVSTHYEFPLYEYCNSGNASFHIPSTCNHDFIQTCTGFILPLSRIFVLGSRRNNSG